MRPEDLRAYPRHKVILPTELQSVDVADEVQNPPSLRFESITRDISLGGLLVELREKARGLDPNWQPTWFRDRFFWVHIRGISTIPDGIFTKAKAVRLVGEDQTHPEAVGLAFQDLPNSVTSHLKAFLESIKR